MPGPAPAEEPNVDLALRLAPGVTLAAAEAELALVQQSLEVERPGLLQGRRLALQSFQDAEIGFLRGPLLTLLAAAALVVMIACANVANLLLAAGTARQREVSLRRALGASRWQVARLALGESSLLAACGVCGGIILAFWTVPVILSSAPDIITRADRFFPVVARPGVRCGGWKPRDAGIRPRSGAAVVAGAGDGSAQLGEHHPGWASSMADVGLVAVQAAVGVILVVATALMLVSLSRLTAPLTELDAGSIAVVRVDIAQTQASARRIADAVTEQLIAPSGGRLVAASGLPLHPVLPVRVTLPGQGAPAPTPLRSISTGYFARIGQRVVLGRDFSPADRTGSPDVAIVSETLARRVTEASGDAAIGASIEVPLTGGARSFTVVGVAADVRATASGRPGAEIYVPLAQVAAATQGSWFCVIGPSAEAGTFGPATRRLVRQVDVNTPVADPSGLDEQFRQRWAFYRFRTSLITAFGVIALLLGHGRGLRGGRLRGHPADARTGRAESRLAPRPRPDARHRPWHRDPDYRRPAGGARGRPARLRVVHRARCCSTSVSATSPADLRRRGGGVPVGGGGRNVDTPSPGLATGPCDHPAAGITSALAREGTAPIVKRLASPGQGHHDLPRGSHMARRLLAGLAWLSYSSAWSPPSRRSAPVDDAALAKVEARRRRLAVVRARLLRAALQPARSDQRRQRREARPGVAVRDRDRSRPRGDAARRRRRDVHDRVVERHLRDRRAHRQAAVEVRPRGASQVRQPRLLRRRQSRRRVLQGQGLRRRARRPAGRDRCDERQGRVADDDRRSEAAVHDHRRAAHRERQGHHRQRRRGVRRARLRVGLRRRDRQARVALLHRARRSVEAAGEQGARQGAADVEGRRLVEVRRRRHGVGFDRLRPRAEPALRRHRQRVDVEPRHAQPRRRRQSLSRVDPRDQSRQRRAGVALPDDARRYVGLHGGAADDARRSATSAAASAR